MTVDKGGGIFLYFSWMLLSKPMIASCELVLSQRVVVEAMAICVIYSRWNAYR
jgi:hypothetical protein